MGPNLIWGVRRYYTYVNADLTFFGNASSDAESAIQRYHFSFGDGSSHIETPDYVQPPGDGQQPDVGFNGWTTHSYSAPGIYTVTLTVTDSDSSAGYPPDKSATATISLAVIVVDIDIQDVPDDKEYDPGGCITLNVDDDDDNGVPDKDDPSIVDGEDNLVTISLSVQPALTAADGVLRISTNAPTSMRI